MRTAIVLLVLGGLTLAGGADGAAALLAKGKFKEAAEQARALATKNAKNADAWLVLADALLGMNEPEEAWTATERAIEENPDEARLSLKLGDIFVKLAEKEQAGARDGTTINNFYLDAERMYEEAHAKDPKSADALYGIANANFWRGTDETKAKAKDYLGRCLMLDKDHGRAHALQGYIFYVDGTVEKDATRRRELFAQAQQKYEIAVKLDDSDPLTFVRWGHSCYAQGKYDEAKKAYLAGVARHPDSEVAILSGLYNLARREGGNYMPRLTPMLEEAVKLSPKSAIAHYHLGYSLLSAERFEEALAAYNKALALKPDNAAFHYQAGYAHEKLGNEKGALDHYRRSLELAPDYEGPTQNFYRLIVVKRGDMDSAEKYFEELIKLSPNTAWLHNDYALILRDWAEATRTHKQKSPPAVVRRRLQRSGEVYEIAARLAPDTPQIQSDCGLLFEFYPCNFDAEKAKRYFTRALDIGDFTYRDAFDGLNRLCRRTGDWETLRDYAESVVGALEDRGKQAVAPVGGQAPREWPNETPGMLARAKRALDDAEAALKRKAGSR